MKRELETLINNYYDWLKDKTHLIEDKQTGWVAISTPFTGIFNDGIEIFCRKNDNRWILSDGGETLQLLKESGVNINRSKKRKAIVKRILNNYGISQTNNEFKVEVAGKNFIQKKHDLTQALLELHDLEHLAYKKVKTLFEEDVENYLKEKRAIYTKDVKFMGYNGLNYHFDFQFPKLDKEVVLKATETLRKNTVSSFVYSWEKVKEVREEQINKRFDSAILIKDTEKKPNNDLVEALEMEGVETYYWSRRDEFDDFILN